MLVEAPPVVLVFEGERPLDLERVGHPVERVGAGPAAIAKVHELRAQGRAMVAVVVAAPRATALRVARDIRQVDGDVRLVFLTDASDEDPLRRAVTADPLLALNSAVTCPGKLDDVLSHDPVDERMRHLQALYQLSMDVTRASGVDEILTLTMEAAQRTLNADRASVFLLDTDGVMRVRAWHNVSDRFRHDIVGHIPWASDETPRPLMIEELRDGIERDWLPVFEAEGIRSVAFIPLLHEDRLVGKLTLGYEAPRKLSEDELHLAYACATHIAFAIERRRAEDALRQSEERYHKTFDEAPIGIAHSSVDGRLVRVNRRLAHLIGHDIDETLVHRWQDLIHPDDRDSEIAAVHRLISGAIDRYTREKRFVRPDGTHLWALLSTSVMRDGDGHGQSSYFVTTVQDVSQRKRYEEALLASEEQLRVALQEGQMQLLDWALQTVDRPARGRSRQWDTGYAPTDDVMNTIHPQDRAAVIQRITEAAHGDGEYIDEFRVADGRWSEVRSRIQRGRKGLPVRLSGLRMDITERKIAEFHRSARQHITDALASAPDLESAAPDVLRALGRNLDWTMAELWTQQDRGNHLRRLASWAERPAEFAALRDDPDPTIERLWEHGDSLRIATATEPSPRMGRAAAIGLQTMAAFPVRVARQVVGVLTLMSRDNRTVDERLTSTMRDVASVLGQFIQRQSAEKKLREESRVVDTLQRIGGALTAELELDRVVAQVTDEVGELTGARMVAFYYRLEEDLRCTIAGQHRSGERDTALAIDALLADSSNEVIHLDDTRSSGESLAAFATTELRSLLVVPVMSRGGQRVGGWLFAHEDAGMFTEREERIAAGIAAWSAVAVENASLYDQTRSAEEEARGQLEFTRTITGSLGEGVYAVDTRGLLTFANPAFEELFGWSETDLMGAEVEPLIGSPGLLRRVVESGRTIRVDDLLLRRRDGSTMPAACTASPVVTRGQIVGACMAVGDITEQRRVTALMAAEKRVLGRIAEGAPLESLLDDLITVVEEQSHGLRLAVHLANAARTELLIASAPSLPTPMKDVFARQAVSQNLTPSAAAAGSLQSVTVPDIGSSGGQWAEFRTVALAHELRAALAMPIVGTDGLLIGVLTAYYTAPRQPPTEDVELLSVAAHVARIAIERQRADQERADLLRRERRARKETEAERKRLNGILESITDAFVSVDREWAYTYVNQRFAEMLGRSRWDLLGGMLWDDFPRSRETDFYHELSYALRDQVTVNFEVESPDLGRWMEVRAYPYQDGLAVYFQDISGRKQLEDARDALYLQLEEQRGRFERVLQQMPAGVLIAGPTGKFEMGNRLVGEILGPSHATTFHDWPLHHLEDERPYESHEYPVARALEKGEVVTGAEALFLRKDGRKAVIRISAAPLEGPLGNVAGVVVAFDDITEKKRAEDGQRFLAQASAELARSLEYEKTLEAVAAMTVPKLADWCSVDVLEERSLATLHRVALARGSLEIDDADAELSRAVRGVVDNGQTVHLTHATCSAIIAPLVARDRTLGAITLISAARGYDMKDVRLVEDLAHRAALACDNAWLHQETERRERRARLIAEVSRELSSSLNKERTLEGVTRLLVPEIADWCAIDVVDGRGRVVDIFLAHHDEVMEQELRELRRRYPLAAGSTPAARAVAEGRCVRVDAFDEAFIHENQLAEDRVQRLQRLGTGSAISAPLLARGTTLGALTVVRAQPHAYRDDDVAVIEEVAHRVALSIDNSRLYRAEREARKELDVLYARERDMVKTLGKSFLGAPPREHPYLDVAAEHRFAFEAHRVGGDYYDFIQLDGRRLGVVVGDVCGKGIQAGVYTAMAKYMLRAYIYEERSLARVLERLNQSLYTEMSDEGKFLTLFVAIVDSGEATLTYANAGHPPPVLFHPGQVSCERLQPTGGLVGGVQDQTFAEVTVPFLAGSILAAFTDGISEADGELDPSGDGGVGEIVERMAASKDAQAIADEVLRHAVRSAQENPRDDAAIVVVRDRS